MTKVIEHANSLLHSLSNFSNNQNNNSMEYTKDQIEVWKMKAEKWDALDNEIAKFYMDEDGEPLPDDEGGDLADIGEAAAIAFGYL